MKKTTFSLGKRLIVLGIVAILVTLTACSGGGTTPPASSSPVVKPPASSAAPPASSAAPTSTGGFSLPTTKIVISVPPAPPATPTGPPLTGSPKPGNPFMVAPKANAVYPTNSVFSQVDVSNIYIVSAKRPNAVGEGHVAFYMDMDVPTTAGQKADALPSPAPSGFKGKVAVVDSLDYGVSMANYSWTKVSNGNHTFGAQLVQNDGTPFNPPIFTQVTVTVNVPSPSPTAK